MEALPIVVRRQQEWLSDRTRRERHSLVIASAIAITVVSTDLLPTKISALGIDFSVGNQAAMLKLLGAITLYLLVSFCAHAFADYAAWKTAFQSALLAARHKGIREETSDEEHLKNVDVQKNKKLLAAFAATPLPKWRLVAVRARDAIDVWFPILLAVFAAAFTLHKAISF